MSRSKAHSRVMMIGLDGCELSIAKTLMAAGRLPAFSRLSSQSASYLLDHGGARRTGLAWEHVSTGLDPDSAERWAAVDFDPASYAARQRATNLTPFIANLDVRAVVVDPPYFDLSKTNAAGLVGWGAHDPGVPTCAQPAGLQDEVRERFGDYGAKEWIYGFVWPSEEKTRRMAEALPAAVNQRGALANWMFGERFPDWELGLVVVSEYHSAVEALWHGVDPTHPLHALPSSHWARRGVEGVYEAGDRLIGELMGRFPDAAFVVFNLHGMGPNNSDNASMALLPELLFRREFRKPLMRARNWPRASNGVPLLREHEIWRREVGGLYEDGPLAQVAKAARRAFTPKGAKPRGQPSLDWMPATRYAPYWPRMRAFALPSFYDGRIRVNLKGREAQGLVEPGGYRRFCEDCADFLRACVDPVTGKPAVEGVEFNPGDPVHMRDSEPDLVVTWTMAPPLGLSHPEIGVVGPLPYRRTGGHTGAHGFAYLHGAGVTPGEFGVRSAFDVVPTVLELLEVSDPPRVSGRSLEPSYA